MLYRINRVNDIIKITQPAEDTTLFQKNELCTTVSLNSIEEFGNYYGLKLNKSKTIGLWIGKSKTEPSLIIHDIKFSNTSVKALGVYFGNNKE